MRHKPIPLNTEKIAKEVINSAFQVHKQLGPGLLEKVYETCFCYELSKAGLDFQRQVKMPIFYDGKILEDSFRIDVLVENKIICELKSVTEMSSIFEAQLLTYLKLTEKRLGFLINFNVELIKDGIQRIVL